MFALKNLWKDMQEINKMVTYFGRKTIDEEQVYEADIFTVYSFMIFYF